MKLLVFSDSHRALSGMRRAVEAQRPDYVLHLGDLEQDAQALAGEYPQLPVAHVPGNCDGWFASSPLQKLVTYGGKKVLMSHGHIWGVKSGYDKAIAAGRAAGADLLLFGHTHIPHLQRLEEGMWVMNPGSIRDSDSYGVVTIEGERMSCLLERLER